MKRVVIVLAIVLTATAANATTLDDAGHVRAAVMFVGDSNIGLAMSAVASTTTQIDQPFMIVDVARAGTSIRSPNCKTCATNDFWLTRLEESLYRLSPDGIVVNLGVNDTLSAGTATGLGYANYAGKIDWLMGQLPNNIPVWWTNLPCSIEAPSRARGCAVINSSLNAARARWPNLTILGWAGAAKTHRNYLSSSAGSPHLSALGSVAWAQLVTNALMARFPI